MKCISCPSGYTWNGTQCIPNCQPGYYWSGTACIPVPPPAPALDAAIPAGNVTVSDFNLGTMPGVRDVRVIVKRWFKIQRLYTDKNGHFTATLRFKHKVKVVSKFISSYADIRAVKGVRFWEMYYPLAKTLGVYSGNKSNIAYNFPQYLVGGKYANNKGNSYWTGATVHNSVQEHRDYSTQFNFEAPPAGLTIMLTDWAIAAGSASSPLFRVRSISSGISNDFITMFIGNGGVLTPLNIPNIDIIMDYHIDYNTNPNSIFSSDYIKSTIYHELSHTSQYIQQGNAWYTTFVTAEAAELGHNILSPMYRPYGQGNTANSPIIALGEAWGYHMGFFLADQKYNVENSLKGDPNILVQDGGYQRTDGVALEYFIPTLSVDPFRWIPKGLIWDLMDNNNPPNLPEPSITLVNDGVYGYTIGEIFAAYQSDITSESTFKARLLQQNPTNTTNSQVAALFTSYGY